MNTGLDKNILVVSDLHLGEDLRPGGTSVSYLRHLVRLERELEAFLRHHTEQRLAGRPWRLVINGDMVDFMSMVILPDAKDGLTHDAEDRLYGLGSGERSSQRKLERVIARHQGVFGALAAFVHAGNELAIVVGNHDVEFHYPSVQRTLVEWLCGLSVGAGAPEEERAAFDARVQFCPWFYYREDLIYIEHGHQYDEYCSFDYLLHPVTTAQGGKKSALALSVAHAGMRYFASQLPDYDPHTAESWGVVNYMKWGWAQGLRGGIRVFYLYGLLVWRLVEMCYALRRADTERRQVHSTRLRQLSSEYEIAEEKLIALDRLRRFPASRRLLGVLQAMFLDRLLLGALGLGTATVLALRLEGGWRLGGPLLTLLAVAVVNAALDRVRLESPAAKLRTAPELIRRLIRAPFIVFGHSHTPETVALEGGATYFNTGTWASEDVAHAFTHLVVTGGDAPHAELRQWRNGASAPYRR